MWVRPELYNVIGVLLNHQHVGRMPTFDYLEVRYLLLLIRHDFACSRRS